MLHFAYPAAGASVPMELAPTPDARNGLRPGRLRSLWDIMFAQQTGSFLRAVKSISNFAQILDTNRKQGQGCIVASRSWADLRKDVLIIQAFSEGADLSGTEGIAADLFNDMARHNGPREIFLAHDDEFRIQSSMQRLTDIAIAESKNRWFLALTANEFGLWQPSRPLWGQTFHDKFASCRFDLEEAAKCLAVGRGTACAFHVVRILEIGLRAVRACLGVQAPLNGAERNWGQILLRIRDARAAKQKGWPEKAYFDEVYALLDAVKGRWRDATMHVEEKYTEDEARRLLEVVQGFMQRLSERMDQEGCPKA